MENDLPRDMSDRRYTYVAIVGSRTAEAHQVQAAFTDLYTDMHVIVSGGARGADRHAKEIALKRGFHYVEVPADWSRGKQAGYERNAIIVDLADEVIAIWDSQSKGTLHTITLAQKQNKPVKAFW